MIGSKQQPQTCLKVDLSSQSSVCSSSSIPDTEGIQAEDGGPSSSTVTGRKNTYFSGELNGIAQESFLLLAFMILRYSMVLLS